MTAPAEGSLQGDVRVRVATKPDAGTIAAFNQAMAKARSWIDVMVAGCGIYRMHEASCPVT